MFSQCPGYKKVGLTAGFDPNGGGFAQYVRALPWVAERGMVAIPDDISFDEASFIEPVNTCIKAVEKARVAAGETVVVMGLGPIGLLLAMLSKLEGATVIGSDPMPERRAKSVSLGVDLAVDPREGRLAEEISSRTARARRGRCAGRCADSGSTNGRAKPRKTRRARAIVCSE